MSWKATAFVKPLVSHTDGTPLTAREKLILFVLADSHNEDYNCAWIGIEKASRESLTSRSRFIYLLNRLDNKGTIRIERREGRTHRYFFPGLPVLKLDGSKKRPVPELDPTRPVAVGPTRPVAVGPEPLSSLHGTDIQPLNERPVIDLALEAIRESQKTGQSADEIMKRMRGETNAA